MTGKVDFDNLLHKSGKLSDISLQLKRSLGGRTSWLKMKGNIVSNILCKIFMLYWVLLRKYLIFSWITLPPSTTWPLSFYRLWGVWPLSLYRIWGVWPLSLYRIQCLTPLLRPHLRCLTPLFVPHLESRGSDALIAVQWEGSSAQMRFNERGQTLDAV